MKKLTILILVSTVLLVSSCKKTGTLTVNVKRQSTGQPIVTADSVVVLVKNTANIYKFYEGLSSSQGIAIFEKVDNADYEVSSEMWDGSKGLTDKQTIQVAKGKSVSVDLLLQ